MKIRYQYKGKLFDDLRDIVCNFSHRPEIDFDTLLYEYLPFQMFLSGRTLFKGVIIEPSVKFDPAAVNISTKDFDSKKFFSQSIKDYLKEKNVRMYNVIAAVSGGVDSSVVALETTPRIIYSGYYDDLEYDETEYSAAIAKLIGAKHIKIKLTEDDFLNNLGEASETFYTPAGGFGSVMEYALLKKVLVCVDGVQDVLFGHGGDEIFMGYFYNHFVNNFSLDYPVVDGTVQYMPNFAPTGEKLRKDATDLLILAAINRGPKSVFYNSFVMSTFLPMLDSIDDILCKLLYVNINCTLPTLLHLVQQTCNALDVKGYSPLASKMFIEVARDLNTPMSLIPKQKLREVHPDMPESISTNYVKRGFPIPLKNWGRLDEVMEENYLRFWKRFAHINSEPYSGVNRYSWGVLQAELFLQRNL